jgi:hypothetical protein
VVYRGAADVDVLSGTAGQQFHRGCGVLGGIAQEVHDAVVGGRGDGPAHRLRVPDVTDDGGDAVGQRAARGGPPAVQDVDVHALAYGLGDARRADDAGAADVERLHCSLRSVTGSSGGTTRNALLRESSATDTFDIYVYHASRIVDRGHQRHQSLHRRLAVAEGLRAGDPQTRRPHLISI